MSEVNVRELRNRGNEVLDRVTGGETLTITRDGVLVAELPAIAAPARRRLRVANPTAPPSDRQSERAAA